MTRLDDVVDVWRLNELVDGGYIRRQVHPELPLAIYNYSEKAAYEKVWNHETLTCRGLIVDTETDEVIARPFPKFFNHGEAEAGDIDMTAAVSVTDKADGSLGILFRYDDEWHIATRGSFASVQAQHATELYRERYASFLPVVGRTYLFEIVYPENRIVLDYGDLDDLIQLGSVDIATGKTYGVDPEWFGPSIEQFDYATLAEALAAPPRPNAEGLVVHFVDSDTRVKVKQDDYVALHRIVTGLNARTVWQHLMAGGTVQDLCEPLPDEFHAWVAEVAGDLRTKIVEMSNAIEADYLRLVMSLPGNATRKDFAMKAKDMPNSWALFAKADGKDYAPKLWKQIDPGAEWRPTSGPSEEAA